MMQNGADAGQDSFLDIVANLVGILIILVVIVGAQAAVSWQNIEPTDDQIAQIEEVRDAAEKEALRAKNVQLENHELHRKLELEQQISSQLAANRHELLKRIEEAKAEMKSRESKLDRQQFEANQIVAEIEATRQKIHQVRYEFTALKHHAPIVETIEHFPTPIAKTVFSDEIHFQIKDGRIAYVPMNELITEMRNQWKVKANKLQSAENAWEIVKPISNFRLQYLLKASKSTKNPSSYGIQFQRFEIQGVSSMIGEEVDEALQSGSDFRSRLNRMAPGKTTVSLWVFPNDYDELIEIRNWLRQNQFQTASWPLKEGQAISGGPQGFRTSAN